MAKRKVIRNTNRPFTYNPHYYSWGGDFKSALGGLGAFDLKGTFSGANVANMLKGGLASGLGSTTGNIAGGAIAGGLESGAGSAISNIGGTIGGAIGAVNPVLGGIVSAASGVLGGLTNRMFGSKLNEETISGIESSNKAMNTLMVDSSSFDSVSNQWANQNFGEDFSKSDIGKDGWFSNKAKNKYKALQTQQNAARNRALTSFENAAESADTQSDLNILSNFAAYGGPIHIKPSKRGTFTAAAKKRGMGVQEFASKVLSNKEDYSPAMVKKANFARNASKWKHADGGPLDTRMELLRRLEEKRRRSNYGGGEFGGAGASSLFLNSPDEYVLEKDTIYLPYRETFNDAFGRARAAGLDEFMFNNKAYTTELGDNPDNNRAGEERVVEGIIPIERTVKKKKANGGQLFTNGVTMVGNGGTHEQNPMEGVPMGIDPNGIPNLVEEGEVIFNDYVFSNRLNVPDAVREKYKLRGNKELTFADAAKQIQKESEERPNDPISKRGLESAMLRLQQAQEAVREEKQASQEGREYAHGGKIGILFDGLGEDSNWLYTPFGSPTREDVLMEMEETYPFLKREEMSIAPIVRGAGISDTNTGDNSKSSRNLSWLRYAPVVGSAIGLGQNLLSKPDYSNADAILAAAEKAGTYTPVGFNPIGNYLQYNPLDRNFYINKLNAQAGATRRAIMNTSSPARNAALLAADYNAQGKLGDLARQAEEYNLAQRQAVETFNRATNMANAEMGLKAAMANQEAALNAGRTRLSGTAQAMAMRDEIAARRGASMSANLTNLFDSLGNIGIDEMNRADRDMLIRAGVFGTLSEKPQGWSNKRWEDYKKTISGKGYSRGGQLKKKRGGFTY